MKPATAKLITPAEPEPLNLVPLPPAPPAEISWDRAKALWHEATKGAEAIIELGYVLQGLKNEFFNQGGETKFGSSARGRTGEKGWQQTVEEELGITKQTALRLIEKADALERLTTIASGEAIEWKDSGGSLKVTEPTPEAKALAAQVIPDVVSGLMNPRRAWAGVCGEAARSEMGKQRSEVDHAGVMLRAIRSVRAAVKKWGDLEPEDRAEVERAWADLLGAVPSTWKGHTK